ncbi:MAG: GAF domain-containing protein [Rhizobiales bacterium]|nr:GAF domain-containing protein [Rhizobacter sp.]
MLTSPAFGQADLTNCERELIHLAGSVQPHGLLLALREPELRVILASANVQALLGVHVEGLLKQPVAELGGDIHACIRKVCGSSDELAEPAPLRCKVQVDGRQREFEGTVHRVQGAGGSSVLLVEIEPVGAAYVRVDTVDIPGAQLRELLGAAVQRFSAASAIGTLADGMVRCFRDMLGYDRVMVYKFDPDGHGKIIAEARDPRLESLLGHHYPASDIPQRARELYLRNRLRVLVDVHCESSPLVPRQLPGAGEELDMSMCQLRSMSPLHLQYLKNMGVTATLVVSLVREGRLWGLIACHHYAPRNLRFAVRAAAALLAEVVATRIAAIENYAHAQVAIQVRRLEQRLVEATSTEGDWRLALFRNPRTVLQPLEATGAALFHEGELLTAGEAPSTAELRALMQWIDAQPDDGLFSCSSVARANPALDSLTPTASGVLAVKLSTSKPDYLMWFRKEQLLTVTWAGDPSKPMVANNPLELSPRSSFAAWSEIVRGTALPWSTSELALGRAFGASLVDIIVQINAVRLLIAEHQLGQIRTTVGSSVEPVVIGDASGRALFANEAFAALRGQATPMPLGDLPALFTQPDRVARLLAALASERQPWRGELSLVQGAGKTLPVAVRAEIVPARDGSVLGFFMIFVDLTDSQRATEARQHLEQSLSQAVDAAPERDDPRAAVAGTSGDVMGAILANASLAAMDIADGSAAPTVAPLLEELEASTRRAAQLYSRIKLFDS